MNTLISCEFCFKNIILEMKSGDSLFLWGVIWFPTSENKHSKGTDVALIQRYFLASFDIIGNSLFLSSHHRKGSTDLDAVGRLKYFSNSPRIVADYQTNHQKHYFHH